MDLDHADVKELAGYRSLTSSSVVLMVSTWAQLRTVVVPCRLLGRTPDLAVHVTDEDLTKPDPPFPVFGGLNDGKVTAFRCRPRTDGGTVVRLRAAKPLKVSTLIESLTAGAPTRLLQPSLRIGLVGRSGERFVVGNPDVAYVGFDDVIETGGVTVPIAEAVLVGPDEAAPSESDPRPHLAVEPSGWRMSRTALDPVVRLAAIDTTVVNPVGFDNSVGQDTGTIVESDGRLAVVGTEGRPLLRLHPADPLSRSHIATLRHLRWIQARIERLSDPVAYARLIVELAAAGIPSLVQPVPEYVADLLSPALLEALQSLDSEMLSDDFLREAASVRVRRLALRDHGPGVRWRELARRLHQPVPDEPTVSVVLVTKRPAMVRDAIQQVARQTYPQKQLVLGLHGEHFDVREVEALASELDFPHEVVPLPGALPFGSALDAATKRCDGRVVTKWDDDDQYGSEHIWDLVLAADYSGADVVGKVAEFTVVEDRGVTVRRNPKGGERFVSHVAGGTLTFTKETWHAVGGWRPVPRFVDDAFLRQCIARGGSIYRTHGFGYLLVRHGSGHTWDPGSEYFLQGEGHRWPVDSPLQRVALEQIAP